MGFLTRGQCLVGLCGALILAGASGIAAESPRYPPHTVLLFVAGWCAPCHAEIARLASIADGAQPFTVRVVVLDDTRRGREMVRDIPAAQRWQPAPPLLRSVQAELFADTSGLPYSVAVGADGRPCAHRSDGLNLAKARLLVQACQTR